MNRSGTHSHLIAADRHAIYLIMLLFYPPPHPRSNRLQSSYRHRYVIFAMHKMYDKTLFGGLDIRFLHLQVCVVL